MRKTLIDVGKDIFIAFVIVMIAMGILFAYCRIWPPMVVVESGSMQRYDDRSVVGVIDTGDMVFVKSIGGTDDLTTYVDGEGSYLKYGTYGDVVIYRPNGETERLDGSRVVPIIHRLVVWLDVNESRVNPDLGAIDYDNYTFDVPSLSMYGTLDDIVLTDYGYWKDDVTISLGGLLNYYMAVGKAPHGGYITMGDHNVPAYDQPSSGSYEPVLPEWIVGKAIGELPWFGLIKLSVTGANLQGVPGNSWTYLIVTLSLLLLVPFLMDMLMPWVRKRRRKAALEVGEGKKPEQGEAGASPEEKAEPLVETGDDGEEEPSPAPKDERPGIQTQEGK